MGDEENHAEVLPPDVEPAIPPLDPARLREIQQELRDDMKRRQRMRGKRGS